MIAVYSILKTKTKQQKAKKDSSRYKGTKENKQHIIMLFIFFFIKQNLEKERKTRKTIHIKDFYIEIFVCVCVWNNLIHEPNLSFNMKDIYKRYLCRKRHVLMTKRTYWPKPPREGYERQWVSWMNCWLVQSARWWFVSFCLELCTDLPRCKRQWADSEWVTDWSLWFEK